MNKPWHRSRRYWAGMVQGAVLTLTLAGLTVWAIGDPPEMVKPIERPWEPTPAPARAPTEPIRLSDYIEGFKDGVALPPIVGNRPPISPGEPLIGFPPGGTQGNRERQDHTDLYVPEPASHYLAAIGIVALLAAMIGRRDE